MVFGGAGARPTRNIHNSNVGIYVSCPDCKGTFGPLAEFPDNCPNEECLSTREELFKVEGL